MSSADQRGLQQRTGYSTDESEGYVKTDRAFGGPPHAQGNYPAQGYPVQQNYGSTASVQYQGQAQVLGPDEYVDKHGHVARRRTRGRKFACCLALCWCCTWPCHGPCCGGV